MDEPIDEPVDEPMDGSATSDPSADDTRALEALFFVSDEPLAASVLAQALDMDRRSVESLCDRLAAQLEDRGSGLVLRNIAGGWRLYTHPDTAPIVEQFVLSSRQARLTKAALETLSIVAYKQPVTRHQVNSIRGVNSDGVIRALVDRGLVEEAGREEGPGRPVLYGTTPGFLERLGLPSLAALPSLAPLLGVADVEDPSPTERVADEETPAPAEEPPLDEAVEEAGEVPADEPADES
jgi:segregation and condensation protein B